MAALKDKSAARLRAELAGMGKPELIELVVRLSLIEQHFTAGEIAAATKMSKGSVFNDIRAGLFGDFFKRSDKQLTVPISGIQDWLDSFRVRRNG